MFGKGKLRRQIDDAIENSPDYTISPEYGENQAMAYANLMGRNAGIIQQEENIDAGVADAVGEAQDYSNSAGAILNTLASVSDNRNKALRNLAADEAAINRGKRGELYGANMAMAEERDKEWNYNVNQKHQRKLQALVERKRNRDQFWGSLANTALSAGITAATGGMGGGGGGFMAGGMSTSPSGDMMTDTYLMGEQAGWN